MKNIDDIIAAVKACHQDGNCTVCPYREEGSDCQIVLDEDLVEALERFEAIGNWCKSNRSSDPHEANNKSDFIYLNTTDGYMNGMRGGVLLRRDKIQHVIELKDGCLIGMDRDREFHVRDNFIDISERLLEK